MQHLRTNRPMHIGDLIQQAILPFTSVDGVIVPTSTPPVFSTTTHQVEEGGPVRPAERVPYSSSHKLAQNQQHDTTDGVLRHFAGQRVSAPAA